jgi:hypothetical protein
MKVKIVDNSLVIPKELLKINNVNKVVPVEGLYGYEFKISLVKNEEKEEIYLRLNQDLNNTLNNNNNTKVIYYSEKHLYDLNNLFAYAWIIKYYYLEDYNLYLPSDEGTSLINTFNEKIIKNEKYYLPDNFLSINLENLSNNGNINLLIGGCDISLRDLVNINKRRINTIFKSALKKVIIFSVSNLNNLEVFNSFEKIKILPYFEKSKNNNNSITITDSISSEEEVLDLVLDLLNNNRIYLNIDLPNNILKSVFNKLILKEINVIKKNPELLLGPGILFEKGIPSIDINSFDIIILKLPIIRDYLDIIPFLKILSKNQDIELIIDEKSMDTIERCIYNLISELPQPIKINLVDSIEYPDYQSLLNELNSDFISATEKWIMLEPSQKIKNLDLSNLSNTDYETIRNYVKLKLFKMESLDINTCQLCTPSSPKNRSKKINSLANKINSIDYFCEVTCEIFKNYTIGVVIWTDFFSNKQNFSNNLLKNNIYIYQTTTGKWKYSKNE